MAEWIPYLEAATQLKVRHCRCHASCTHVAVGVRGLLPALPRRPATILNIHPCLADQQEQGRRRRLRVRGPVSMPPAVQNTPGVSAHTGGYHTTQARACTEFTPRHRYATDSGSWVSKGTHAALAYAGIDNVLLPPARPFHHPANLCAGLLRPHPCRRVLRNRK